MTWLRSSKITPSYLRILRLLCAVFAFVVGGFLVHTIAVYAQDSGLSDLANAGVQLGQSNLLSVIARVINIVLGVLGVIAVGLIIYAGFVWMTASGNEEKLQQAKKILSGATIGLVIILASFGIAKFILSRLGEGAGGGDFEGTCADGTAPPCGSILTPGGYYLNAQRIFPLGETVKLCSAVSTEFNLAPERNTITSTNFRIFDVTSNATFTGGEFFPTVADSIKEPYPISYTLRHPGAAFTPNHTYEVSLAGGADGIVSRNNRRFRTNPGKVWRFTTGVDNDTTYPKPLQVEPAVGAQGVCRAARIQVEFSEPMDPSSFYSGGVGNVWLRIKGTEPLIKLSAPISGDGFNIVTLTPLITDGQRLILNANTEYEVVLKSGPTGLLDMCSNQLDGNGDGTPGDDYVWSFTTGETTDCPPQLTAVNPGSRDYDQLITTLQGKNLGLYGDIDINDTLATSANSFDNKENILCWRGRITSTDLPTGITPEQIACPTDAQGNEFIKVRTPVGANTGPAYNQNGFDATTGELTAQIGSDKSNNLGFKITSPVIDHLSPDRGGKDQFVTISGWNFGSVHGRVIFIKSDGTSINGVPPEGCADWWQDTDIVVKVPDGLIVNNVVKVEVFTAQIGGTNPGSKRSNFVPFTITNEPPGPGICSINPTTKAVIDLPTTITIVGERFGANKGSSTTTFNNIPATTFSPAPYSWSDTTVVTKTPIMAAGQSALGAGRHPVCIKVNNKQSNCKDLGVSPDRRLYPQIIEQQTCSGSTQSPSPWKGSTNACANSAISARFNTAVDLTSVTTTNIIALKCNNDDLFNEAACLTPVATTLSLLRNSSNDVNGFILSPTNGLEANYWYRVSVGTGIKSTLGVFMREPYVWTFRGKSDGSICAVDSVVVSPPVATIREIPPSPNNTQDFGATPQAANCNALKADSYTWTWSSSDVAKATLTANNSLPTTTATALAYTAAGSPVHIKARLQSEDKEDTSDLIISPTACTGNEQCSMCGDGMSACVAGNCEPVINSISPPNGAIGSWLTIKGCYFGATRGQVIYKSVDGVGVHGLWPDSNRCGNTWFNTQIISEVPNITTNNNSTDDAVTGPLKIVRHESVPGSAFSHTIFEVNLNHHPDICKIDPVYHLQSKLGTPEAEVRLIGKGFSDTPQADGKIKYSYGSPIVNTVVPATQTTWSDKEIKFITPVNIPVGFNKVSVVNNSIESNEVDYQVKSSAVSPGCTTPPTITSVTPDNGLVTPAGIIPITTVVTIIGSGFGTNGTVYFDDKPAPISQCGMWSPTAINVPVPDSVTGTVAVKVVACGKTSNIDKTFTVSSVLRPSICSITPRTGEGGIQVAIQGRNFTDNRKPSPTIGSFVSTACFADSADCLDLTEEAPIGGAPINFPNRQKLNTDRNILKWASNEIVIQTPNGISSGEIRVSVDYGNAPGSGGLRKSNGAYFSAGPFITRITPTTGKAGTWMTISGGNFGDAVSTVSFAGATDDSPRILSGELPDICSNTWTDNQIVVKVPVGVGTGLVKVKTANNIETKLNDSKRFILDNNLPLSPGLCSLVPSSTTILPKDIVLKGDNFGSALGRVIFTGKTVEVKEESNWSSTSISTQAPSGIFTGPVFVERKQEIQTGIKCNGNLQNGVCTGTADPLTEPIMSTITTFSNPLTFTVNSENPNVGSDICTNAAIYASFNVELNSNSVNTNTVKLYSLEGSTITEISGTVQVERRGGGSSIGYTPTKTRWFDKALAIIKKWFVKYSGVAWAQQGASNPNEEEIMRVTFTPNAPGLLINTHYRLVIAGGPNGVRGINNEELPIDGYVREFITSNKACALQSIVVTSSDGKRTGNLSFTTFEKQSLTATAYSSNGVELQLNGWQWREINNGSLLAVANPNMAVVEISPAGQQNGHGELVVSVSDGLNPPTLKSVNLQFDIFLCDFPWILDDNTHYFRLRYCRGKIDGNKIKLSDISVLKNGGFESDLTDWVVNGSWSSTAIKKRTGDKSAISVPPSNNSLVQVITNLTPGSTYQFEGYVATPLFDTYQIMVNNVIAFQSSESSTDPSWHKFVTNIVVPTNGQVEIKALNNSVIEGSVMYIDDFSLREVIGLLPELSVSTPRLGESNDLLREYFMGVKNSTDVLGLRVYKNLDYLSPRAWYDSRPDITKGATQELKVDGYQAVQDGQTVYVAGLKQTNDPNVTYIDSEVYVLTYNQKAAKTTAEIFNSIIKDGWNFNLNHDAQGAYTITSEERVALLRDRKRIEDLKLMSLLLEDYATEHNGNYPTLPGGTYLPGKSVSTWGSWQAALGNTLGKAVPVDPVNKLEQCPAGYAPNTCWNNQAQSFVCPLNSHAYFYDGSVADSYDIRVNFEYTGVTWRGRNPSDTIVIPSASPSSNADDTCSSFNYTLSPPQQGG